MYIRVKEETAPLDDLQFQQRMKSESHIIIFKWRGGSPHLKFNNCNVGSG